MIDQKTDHLQLPLPHPLNQLQEDVLRLRTALANIDGMLWLLSQPQNYEPADPSILKAASIGVSVQGYDVDLGALAALTGTGLLERTGSGTAATVPVTAAGKALLDDADAAAQRTTLGLVIGTHVQAFHAILNALSALSTAGLIERAIDGTVATATVTAAGKALLDDADAAAQRATLGLKPSATKDVGTGADDVAAGNHTHATLYQPIDSDLTAVAGLSSTGLIERTGTGTANTVPVTAAGKALLDDADAATQRATLGLGSAATMAGPSGDLVGTTDAQTLSNKTITGLRETKTAPSISSNELAINCTSGNVFRVTLNANITSWSFSNVPPTGTAYGCTLELVGDGTQRTITWPASVKWPGGKAPTPTKTNSKVDRVVLTTHDGGTTWYAVNAGQNY